MTKHNAGTRNGIRALRGRPAGRLLLSGARGSVAAALGHGDRHSRRLCRRRCARDAQAHYPKAVAPWAGVPWGALGRDCHAGSGRPDNLAGAGAHGPLCASAGRERGRRPWLSAARRTDPRQRGCEAEARRHGRRPRSRPSPVDLHAARCPHGRPDPRPTAPLPMARPNPRCACACAACAHGPAADKFDAVTLADTVTVAAAMDSRSLCRIHGRTCRFYSDAPLSPRSKNREMG